ncbi:hypothetical protein FLLO111716_00990 [Flavobacterium longum]|uniref:hypothetical protein n=1 Tax=Flavobacterium longum TaxID=1299340 RepID=UPI0039E838DF
MKNIFTILFLCLVYTVQSQKAKKDVFVKDSVSFKTKYKGKEMYNTCASNLWSEEGSFKNVNFEDAIDNLQLSDDVGFTNKIQKTQEAKILGKDELTVVLNLIKLYSADLFEAKLREQSGNKPFGHVSRISNKEKIFKLDNTNTVEFRFWYDEIEDLLYQPVFSDCDCEVVASLIMRMTVQDDKKLALNFSIYPGGIGINCGSCPLHQFVINFVQLFAILKDWGGFKLLDQSYTLLDQASVNTRINNLINDVSKSTNIKNDFVTSQMLSFKIVSARFSDDGLFITYNYEVGVK